MAFPGSDKVGADELLVALEIFLLSSFTIIAVEIYFFIGWIRDGYFLFAPNLQVVQVAFWYVTSLLSRRLVQIHLHRVGILQILFSGDLSLAVNSSISLKTWAHLPVTFPIPSLNDVMSGAVNSKFLILVLIRFLNLKMIIIRII